MLDKEKPCATPTSNSLVRGGGDQTRLVSGLGVGVAGVVAVVGVVGVVGCVGQRPRCS
jgi:hypothetical protein